ncbi:hypothetical protein BTH42_10265 [Burkholderia sp. SRS-W-2-2016]|uniref:MFS transporter n=1 Tax=Burkholderia sp. SRS-W-2-2016 TaxID=1926878 RepID=UPI00094AABDE|nr:MFS transporter [Burkholderia sp. SRS-W-2-2016]OLL31691.1 hypothetical protein BTH42_10265 [Burkholderia sp. SRS-W-2-2016]
MSAVSIQNQQGTNRVHWTTLQVVVVAICSFINGLDGMDLLVMSYAAPAMAADWHIGFATLGVVFSAGMAGMLVGCLCIAPFADTMGRRPIVLFSLIAMALGSFGSGLTHDLNLFIVARFIAGLGLGTLLASVAALVSEYAPEGRRTVAVGIFQAGYPIGAVLTGIVCIYAIPAFGWQATFIGAGLITAVTVPIVAFCLPESVAFLEVRQPKGALERSNALRKRLDWPAITVLPQRTIGNLPKPAEVLSAKLRNATLAIWIATFLSYGVLYFVASWVPKIAVAAGLSHTNAIWAGSLVNMGGVCGDIIIGALAVRRPVGNLIAIFFVFCAVLMMIFAQPLPLTAILISAFGLGFTLYGGFSAFYSLAAQLYPARLRSSGIGWMAGIGRGGAIIGPLAGGALLAANTSLPITFLCFAIPLVISGGFAALASHFGRSIPTED